MSSRAGHSVNYLFVPGEALQNPASASEKGLDYYPYGSILREFVNGQQEKYLTTHHERDQETGLDYRGARYYDSDVARFLSLDPLAAEYASWSPYNYVLGNPISLIDPKGTYVDNYSVDQRGNVRLIEKTSDPFDVLVGRSLTGAIETTIIQDQSILPQLAQGAIKTGTGADVLWNNVAHSKDHASASEAFVFLATHSKVEWGFHIYGETDQTTSHLLVTSHQTNKVASGDWFCDPGQELFHIHSHVGPAGEAFDPATLGTSWTGDIQNANERAWDYLSWGKVQPGYAVFHAPSQHLHTYSPGEQGHDLGRINNGVDLMKRTSR